MWSPHHMLYKQYREHISRFWTSMRLLSAFEILVVGQVNLWHLYCLPDAGCAQPHTQQFLIRKWYTKVLWQSAATVCEPVESDLHNQMGMQTLKLTRFVYGLIEHSQRLADSCIAGFHLRHWHVGEFLCVKLCDCGLLCQLLHGLLTFPSSQLSSVWYVYIHDLIAAFLAVTYSNVMTCWWRRREPPPPHFVAVCPQCACWLEWTILCDILPFRTRRQRTSFLTSVLGRDCRWIWEHMWDSAVETCRISHHTSCH